MTTQQPTETPTPRADANTWTTIAGAVKFSGGGGEYVPTKLARQLERELATARAEIARLKAAGEKLAMLVKILTAKVGDEAMIIPRKECPCMDRVAEALAAWENLK